MRYSIHEADAFARRYAERSGVTVEFLREHGRIPLPCDCGEEICEGWQMAHVDRPAARLQAEDARPGEG